MNEVSTVIETALARYYSDRFGEPMFVAVGLWSKWDLSNRSASFTVEVKFDSTATRTGHLALETFNAGKPSGLSVTEALRWCHCVPGADPERITVYEFKVETLRRVLPTLTMKRGGYELRSTLVLLPVEQARTLAESVFAVRVRWSEYRPSWITNQTGSSSRHGAGSHAGAANPRPAFSIPVGGNAT